MASISSVIKPEQTNSSSILYICDILNKHFTDIGPRMDAGINATSQNFLHNLSSLPNSFCFTDITPDEVLLKLPLLDCKKSAEPENIPIQFIKMISTIVASYLSELNNLCYKPDFRKFTLTSSVRNIFGRSDRTVRNYFP